MLANIIRNAKKTPAAPTTDPNFNSVSLLLHMDGSSGSTNFVDSGPNALAVTAAGNAQISDTQSKYGGASGYFDGSGDYLTVASNAALDFGSGDFTIELWVRLTSAANFGGLASKGPNGSINNTVFSLEFNNTSNAISFFVGPPVEAYIVTGITNIRTSGTWQHVAVCRSGNNTRLFINGIQEGSTYTGSYTIGSGNPIYIGGGFYSPTTNTVTGNIDDLRITKGLARFTSSFAPPAQAHPNIYNPYTTLPVSGAALWLDASQQNTIFSDAGTTPVTTSGQSIYQWNDLSGNNRHAVQATSGNRPTWVPPASGQNGLGVVNFTGSPVRMTGSSLGLSSTATYIGVIKTSGTNGKLINYWLSIYSDTSWHALRVGGVYGDSTNGAYSLAYTESSALSNFGTNANSYTVADDSIANMIAYVYDKNSSSNNKIYKNNASQSLINNLISNSIPSGNYMLGMRSDLAWDVNARFCEVIVYPNALSSGDLTTMYSYLKTKWGTP